MGTAGLRAGICLVLLVGAAGAAETPVSLTLEPAVTLRGKDAHQQLLATGRLEGGAERDLTRRVTYSVTPPEVARVDANGLVSALADGTAAVTATADGVSTTLELKVEGAGTLAPINFANQVVPIFTKNGCNAGGCHGKLSGQNGFRLSLLGFEPAEDYEHLVKEARGRRVFPAAPENSLLLLKGIAAAPHGGGKRLEPGSDDYQLLVRWIAQGMPYGGAADPTLAGIEVLPARRTLALKGEQQLVVMARYSDGSVQDVTRGALFEANDKSMATAGEEGLVTLSDQPGDVAVMVRYQGRVATFRATVPLGAPVPDLPPARNEIDELVFAKLKAMGMPPSEPCDDATFLRRITGDLAGRLPTLEETRAFLAETSPQKRDQLIDRLLESPDYAEYFANKWSALLRNKRVEPGDAPGTFAFHDWIRQSFAENKPYRQFVREILGATGELADNPPVAWYRQVKEPQQQLEDTAQLFLGTRMQCAQCHHHPYEKWSQNDYFSFSAFFSQVSHKGKDSIYTRRVLPMATNKKTKQPVAAAGLGTGPLPIPAEQDARLALADWMSQPDNPLFARALVNRYWKHFFNRGLVEPEDDLRETNPPVNPELLDALSHTFVASDFDLKALIREMTRSQTYQLSAIPNAYNQADRQSFSRHYPKRMGAEVLFDAVDQVTRSVSAFPGVPAGTRAVALPDNSFNAGSYFLTVFGRPESSSACECERTQEASLAQALHLLNAKDIQAKLAAPAGAAAKLAGDPRPDVEKLRELHLVAFAREPEPAELELATAYLARPRKGADGQPLDPAASKRQGYEDILWSLINTKEFLFAH